MIRPITFRSIKSHNLMMCKWHHTVLTTVGQRRDSSYKPSVCVCYLSPGDRVQGGTRVAPRPHQRHLGGGGAGEQLSVHRGGHVAIVEGAGISGSKVKRNGCLIGEILVA
jgi:hypothetical protein